MKTKLSTGIILMIVLATGPARGAGTGEQARADSNIQAISWDAWLAAKTKAEQYDAAGDFVSALQYYLEYTRQAEGLSDPARSAWGKNNAAYMIIKMHRQDPSVDLTPAGKLLQEGLAIREAADDCRKVLAMNLEYVKLSLGRTPERAL